MAGTFISHDDDPAQPMGQGSGPTEPVSDDAPTRPLVGMGDRCVTCDAPLAPDQRYCLNCGERRGKSRFPGGSLAGPQPEPAAASSGQRHEPPRRRLSSGATLVAGIATLLLAMGVGVLIGHLGKNNSGGPVRAAQPVQVVTVGGGGGAATTTPAAAADTGANSNTKASKSSKSTKKSVVVTKKVAAKANQAASKVLGASSANLAPTQVQQGQSCSHGAGCQNGKFTGNFFGP